MVGLAVARRLAQAGREVLLLEAAEAIGTGISSRNSEVIHAASTIQPAADGAGLRRWRRALYLYCKSHGVAHRACGKLIVATTEEEAGRLAQIKARAETNGVEDMRLLTAAEAQVLEPALRCTAALHSPHTGIVDSHGFMLSLQGELEAVGGMVVFHSPLLSARPEAGGLAISVGGAEPMELFCHTL